MNDKLVVGIADMKMAQGSGMLVTYALGSCIGICFYDPMLKLAALLHIMLPLNLETGRKSPLKYADKGGRCGSRQPGGAAGNGAARRQTGAGYSQNCRRSPHV